MTYGRPYAGLKEKAALTRRLKFREETSKDSDGMQQGRTPVETVTMTL